jgi:SAM-dependent MidA family methyltransferase
MDGLDVSVLGALDEVPAGLLGCVISNEVMDNLPFHRVRGTGDGIAELYVGLGADGFALVEGPPSSDRVAHLSPKLQAGAEAVVNPLAPELVDRSAALLDTGYLWFVDYGFTGGERAAAPHGYRAHRLEADVLEDPGSKDITSGVDFDALVDRARRAGHSVWGPVSQRDALLSLGYRRLDEEARDRQVRAAAGGQSLEANRIFSARSRASLLVDPHALGNFLVLAVGVGVDVPPSSTRTVG